MIPSTMTFRDGYAVVQGEERVLDVAVKSGSQITLSVGGYVVRVRAVGDEKEA